MPYITTMRVWCTATGARAIQMSHAEHHCTVNNASTIPPPLGIWCVAHSDNAGYTFYYYNPALRGGRTQSLTPIKPSQVSLIPAHPHQPAPSAISPFDAVQLPDDVQTDLLDYVASQRTLNLSQTQRAELVLITSLTRWLKSYDTAEHHVAEHLNRATNLQWEVSEDKRQCRVRVFEKVGTRSPTTCGPLLAALISRRAVILTHAPGGSPGGSSRHESGTYASVDCKVAWADIVKLAVLYWVRIVAVRAASNSAVPMLSRMPRPRMGRYVGIPPCLASLAEAPGRLEQRLKFKERLDFSAIATNIARHNNVPIDIQFSTAFFKGLRRRFGETSVRDLYTQMKRDVAANVHRPTTKCCNRQRPFPREHVLPCMYADSHTCAVVLHGKANVPEALHTLSPFDMVAGQKPAVVRRTMPAKRTLLTVASEILYNNHK